MKAFKRQILCQHVLHINLIKYITVSNESALPIKTQAVDFFGGYSLKKSESAMFFMQSKSVKERPKSEINVNYMNK